MCSCQPTSLFVKFVKSCLVLTKVLSPNGTTIHTHFPLKFNETRESFEAHHQLPATAIRARTHTVQCVFLHVQPAWHHATLTYRWHVNVRACAVMRETWGRERKGRGLLSVTAHLHVGEGTVDRQPTSQPRKLNRSWSRETHPPFFPQAKLLTAQPSSKCLFATLHRRTTSPHTLCLELQQETVPDQRRQVLQVCPR